MIEKYLEKANKPVVLLSGGIDSLVVLDMVRVAKPDIEVITFRQNMSDDQWKIIENVAKLWDLQVLSWPPTHSYVLPNGEELSRVDEYSFNGLPIPLVRDFIPGKKCSLELDEQKLAVMPIEHDVIFTGTRAQDAHPLMPSPMRKPVIEVGPFTFVAPIYDWGKADVEAYARENDLPFSKEFYDDGKEEFDTGNISACTNCLCEGEGYVFCQKLTAYIPRHQWDRSEMLGAFQYRFGLGVTA